jgi:hypothetical protein
MSSGGASCALTRPLSPPSWSSSRDDTNRRAGPSSPSWGEPCGGRGRAGAALTVHGRPRGAQTQNHWGSTITPLGRCAPRGWKTTLLAVRDLGRRHRLVGEGRERVNGTHTFRSTDIVTAVDESTSDDGAEHASV